MTPAVDTAKKGIDGGGPVTEAEIELPLHSLALMVGESSGKKIDAPDQSAPLCGFLLFHS